MVTAHPQLIGFEPTKGSAQGSAVDRLDASRLRATELISLVEDHDVSVRLRNSLKTAHAANALPFKTLGDYADAGAMAQTIMLRDVRNFGRITGRELDALISAVLTGKSGASPAPARLAGSVDRVALIALFAGERLSQLAADELFSARLANVLAQPMMCDLTFAQVLENFSLTIATMLRQPNCGRQSANEFRQFCQRHIRLRLLEAGYLEPDPLVFWLLGGPPPHQLPKMHAICADEGDTQADDGIALVPIVDPLMVPDHDTLVARLEWLLGELDPRAQLIIRRRNGIDQPACETLEEIGANLGVTRERIRQIEAKSLRRMRIRIRRAPIAHLLAAEGGAAWEALAGSETLLRRGDLQDRRKAVSPHVRLALDIAELALDCWLDDVAHAFPYGWLEPAGDVVAITEAGIALEQAAVVPLPRSLATVPSSDAEALSAAAILIHGKPVRYGYLMPPRVGARLTRLVRLHALLAGQEGVIPLERLVAQYRGAFKDDPCTERDAEIVMDAAPHLFLEIADGSWSAIGEAGFALSLSDFVPNPPNPTLEEGTIAGALQATLEARGPTRLVELLDNARTILPEGRSINSIGPVLLTRRELFVRALPGVYALPSHVPAFRASMPEDWPVLFNDYQARLYVLARYAGEPRDIFPLWSPDVEYALCRWARHSGGPGIFASLLSIAVIDDWPIGTDAADDWRRVQRQESRFELGGTLRHTAAYERPPLDRLFAACRYAAITHQFNWVAANRVVGRKIDSHGGAGLVALLLRLGAIAEVEPSGYRWQRPHRATNKAASIAAELETAFADAEKEIDWQSGLGQDLVRRASQSGDDWVDDAALAAMLSRSVRMATPDPDDDDPLAQLLAAQRRVRETERRETTLDWLLEHEY